jgi:uncharacterized protein (TIGR02246 family)
MAIQLKEVIMTRFKHWRVVNAAILLGILINSLPASARTLSSSNDSIALSAADRWGKAFNERDLDALVALYTQDGELLPKGTQAIRGHAEIRRFLSELIASTPESQKTIFTNVQRFGQGNTVSEVADIEIQDDHGRRTILGRQILILQKKDGQWKVRMDMWTNNDKSSS